MSQFNVFGDETNGYGVERSGGIAYDADPNTTQKEAQRLANFHNKRPDATYADYLRYKKSSTRNKKRGAIMTPNIKPTIIPASRFLSDTIAAMIAAGQYCQATLPGGAVMRYKPNTCWAIYRQGERPDQHADAKRFKAWGNELSVFRAAIAKAGQNLADSWVQLVPHQGWYGAKLTIMPTVESLFALAGVQS